MDRETIEVAGLGTPDDHLDDEALAQLADEAAEPVTDVELEAATPEQRGLQVEALTTGIMAPFAIVAIRRGPHWRITDDEARPIAEAMAVVLPANALTDRLVGATPWASAGLQLYALVAQRLESDAQLTGAEPAGQEAPSGPRREPIRRDQGEAGAAAGAAGEGVPGQPGANGARAGDGPGPIEGLGLGAPSLGPGPARRRVRP